MKSLLAISTFLVATSGFAAGTTSTNGQWSMHQNIANNESDQQCTFTQKETTITGTCKSADGKDLPVTGTVDGKKVTWKYDMDFNGTTLTLTYSATLDDSDKVSGSVEVQPYGVSGEFTATPSKDGAK